MHSLTLAVIASIPIVVSLGLLIGLKWSGFKALGVGWLLAIFLGLTVWRMESLWVVAASIYGTLQAFEIILIIFGAILLMNYLDLSGAISTIRWHFSTISEDRRIQLLIIGLGFITIMEGAAGFGTPGALAAPLWIGLGFPPLAAAIFGIIFNAAQPPFGASGTPIIGGVGAVIEDVLDESISKEEFLAEVTAWTSLGTGLALSFWGVLCVFLLGFWFSKPGENSLKKGWNTLKPVLPFALFLGFLAGFSQFLIAWFIGPELPTIIAGFAVFIIGSIMAKKDILQPEKSWDFPDRNSWTDLWTGGLNLKNIGDAPKREMSVLKAWSPYLLVTGILLVTRWPGLGFVEILRQYSLTIPSILGTELSFTIEYLYLPGTMPFIPVAIASGLIYKMKFSKIEAAWKKSLKQVGPAALTLAVAVAMTQVMIQSSTNTADITGMMDVLSMFIASTAGSWFPAISPWIGVLGAFMTGSTTSSNILFSVMQHDAAANTGISRTVAVALQNIGSGIGNMLSILNIVAICSIVGLNGEEGEILHKAIIPTLIFGSATSLLGLILIYIVGVDVY